MAQESIGPTAAEIGSSGLKRSAGLVFEEFLPQLMGPRATKVYTEMGENDPIVGAIEFAFDKLMRQVTWSTEPGGTGPDAKAMQDFLEECMDDMSMSWSDVISEVVTMFRHGWSYLEICYKKRQGQKPMIDVEKASAPGPTANSPTSATNGEQPAKTEAPSSKFNDGKIGWRKMPLRAQETRDHWEFDEHGGIKGMWQRGADGQPKLIPIEKALLFRTTSHKNNPEGRSVFRNAYRPWYYMKRIQELEAVGIERDLAGLPKVFVDPTYFDENASPAKKQALLDWKQVITNLRRDEQEGLLLPAVYDNAGNRLFDVELMSAGGSRQFDIDSVMSRYAQHIAMTVLADWLLLGHEGVGSFALSADKTNLFGIALSAWVDAIADVFNDYAIPRLFELNGLSTENLPKIKPSAIDQPDIGIIATLLQAIVTAGGAVFPNDDLMKALYDMAGLPEPSDEQLKQNNEAAAAAAAAAQQPVAPTSSENATIDQYLQSGQAGGQAAA